VALDDTACVFPGGSGLWSKSDGRLTSAFRPSAPVWWEPSKLRYGAYWTAGQSCRRRCKTLSSSFASDLRRRH